MKQKYIALIFSIIFFLIIGCDGTEPLTNENLLQTNYLGFTNSGCIQSKYSNPQQNCAYLSNYTYKSDTLKLKIHFEANCCPSFMDSTFIDQNILNITLHDTLYRCACICSYENEFIFFYYDKNDVIIKFKSTARPHGTSICSMDTTITLSK
jgi:hypothetical protein